MPSKKEILDQESIYGPHPRFAVSSVLDYYGIDRKRKNKEIVIEYMKRNTGTFKCTYDNGRVLSIQVGLGCNSAIKNIYPNTKNKAANRTIITGYSINYDFLTEETIKRYCSIVSDMGFPIKYIGPRVEQFSYRDLLLIRYDIPVNEHVSPYHLLCTYSIFRYLYKSPRVVVKFLDIIDNNDKFRNNPFQALLVASMHNESWYNSVGKSLFPYTVTETCSKLNEEKIVLGSFKQWNFRLDSTSFINRLKKDTTHNGFQSYLFGSTHEGELKDAISDIKRFIFNNFNTRKCALITSNLNSTQIDRTTSLKVCDYLFNSQYDKLWDVLESCWEKRCKTKTDFSTIVRKAARKVNYDNKILYVRKGYHL